MLDDTDHIDHDISVEPDVIDIASGFDDTVLDAYSDIVAAAGEEGMKRLDAVELVADRIADAIRKGATSLPIDVIRRLTHRAISAADSSEARRSLDRATVVAEIADGLTLVTELEEPLLDVVAVIGGGLRKTWRHVNQDDVVQMIVAKQQHASDAAVAASEFTKIAQRILRALSAAGHGATVGQLALDLDGSAP